MSKDQPTKKQKKQSPSSVPSEPQAEGTLTLRFTEKGLQSVTPGPTMTPAQRVAWAQIWRRLLLPAGPNEARSEEGG